MSAQRVTGRRVAGTHGLQMAAANRKPARAGAVLVAGVLTVVLLFVASFTGPALADTAGRADAWTAAERAVLASMDLARLPPPPRDPSNAVEADARAVALGRQLFSEVGFSRNQAVSCATCHAPQQQFQDGLALAKGVGVGQRRTMPIAGTAHSPWLFWDGRKDSLWSQALGPLEDALEHGGNRMRAAWVLQTRHRAGYEAVFGPLPDLSGLPQDAGPNGEPTERAAWQAIDPARRMQVNRMFANLGKAIAAFERTLSPGESRFDRYLRAVATGNREGQQVLSNDEVRGLRLFIGKGQCETCHNGALLSDQHFHNTGVPPRDPQRPDRGRAGATAKVQRDEFNCLGAFSDAAPDACQELRFMVAEDPALEGAFKTPSLRGVALRAPYMHAGQFATLEEVVAHYAKSPPAAIGRSELAHAGHRHAERQPIRLTQSETRDLVAFLRTLSGPVLELAQP